MTTRAVDSHASALMADVLLFQLAATLAKATMGITLSDLLDRTVVLFLGVGLGAAMGYSFADTNIAASWASTGAPENAAVALGKGPKNAAQCNMQYTLPAAVQAKLAAGETVHIGVFGDSYGEGIWAGLYNTMRSESNIIVHRFGQQSTGFTRYGSLNLADDTREKLAEQSIDIAVVSFGANDTQGLWLNGSDAPYMSDKWRDVIGARANEMLDLLAKDGAQIVWVGLPPMRKPAFDAQIVQMNEFYADLICKRGDIWLDGYTRGGVDGKFAPYLTDARTGEPKKIRAEDGIHMSMQAYNLLIADMNKALLGAVGSAKVQQKGDTSGNDGQDDRN
jgi:uncharacterized protein